MHDLEQCVRECMQILEEKGIPYGRISRIEVNTRAKCTWGVCRRLPDSSCCISISGRLLEEDVPIDHLRETVLHELLHAGTDLAGHRGAWKYYAQRLNRELGLNIKRTSTYAQKDIPQENIPKPKYQFVCTGCGQTVNRYRASAFTRRYRSYRCGICRGKFQQIL